MHVSGRFYIDALWSHKEIHFWESTTWKELQVGLTDTAEYVKRNGPNIKPATVILCNYLFNFCV